jgi:rhomboid protease GluP
MRQTSGSILCPACNKLIDVDEERCPYCGAWRPGMFGYAGTVQRVLGILSPTTAITWISILLYAASLALDPRAAVSGAGGIFGLLAPGNRALALLGMTYGGSLHDGRWFTMISAVFLHGSLLHIFFNLMWIHGLGPTVEDAFGRSRYFVIFMVAGIGGFLASNLLSGAPTVGASGGVFGLLAAVIAYGRRHGGSVGQAITQRAMMWAGFLLVLGFVGSRVNNFAHLGGFAAGYLASLLFLPQAERTEGPVVKIGALLLAAGAVLSVVLSLVTAAPYFMR